ncbi:MAG: hypothetical protein CL389_09365 [Acidiferrobacteraceae bacterium]|jgi:uncharacterized protein (DUF1015 family)|nr:hypothetical protein [Acidiferrobacteraceae bacterium]MDP6397669.1 DUF1015 domain-containing protein [Arenicellales bacterium]MDP6551442.1 DUF1015 domain-containing protein [Arenicellales bacterium]MDP6790487.1 DUF1015 domain-containing protein [Arenicellales bacterium]MDP6917726.1 DUF1015 domain-containing protein [Arenicellales bacterium]|tara:strand:+ start:25475 stop:26704 length:1230 start_codon:yes stop_codon:yes gene_type:complete
MTQIRAFRPYLVTPGHADSVVAPAYDSMSPEERRGFRKAHPHNYINVMRSVDDFPVAERPSEGQLLKENADQLQGLLASGAYERCDQEGFFVYQLSINGHSQTGIVAEIPVSEYQDGLVRKHEETRKDHEARLGQYLGAVGATSSPICLAYEGTDTIDAIVNALIDSDPILDFPLPDGVHQRLWQVSDPSVLEALQRAFLDIKYTYLTDGHHRAASTLHHAASRHAQGKGSGPWDYLLTALFPASQLRILPFNRCVRDLGGLTPEGLLERLEDDFTIEVASADQAVLPTRQGQFLILMNEQAVTITRRSAASDPSPVKNLDVSVLQDRVLAPLLDIHNARKDPRLDYVTGDSGVAGLMQRCREGWQLGIACFPTSITELMTVANAGEVMPPKSTCFDPKPRSGLFVRMS